jgi:hypothetical protein
MSGQIQTLLKAAGQPAYNEKFMELATKSGIGTQWSYSRHMLSTATFQDLEKFAELIMKECLSQVKEVVIPITADAIESKIKEHFGVSK